MAPSNQDPKQNASNVNRTTSEIDAKVLKIRMRTFKRVKTTIFHLFE